MQTVRVCDWSSIGLLDPGWGSLLSSWRCNGFFWRFTVQWLQKEPPPPCKRRAVVEWPPGWPREISVVFLLSNLGLPIWGLGTWLGMSQACSPRVVEGKCSRTPPSGCLMAFLARGLQTESFWESFFGGGGCNAGASSLAVSMSSLALSQPWPAPCQWAFLWKEPYGEITSLPTKSVGFFLFFLYDFLNYYLRVWVFSL